MILGKKPFENIVGKGENAGNQHFLTVFSTQSVTPIIILTTFKVSSANTFKLDWPQILLSGKELKKKPYLPVLMSFP